LSIYFLISGGSLAFDEPQIHARTRRKTLEWIFVAAPVGHIICALALLNSGKAPIADQNAFFAGTHWPDIRYITDINRSTTHKFSGDGLDYVLDTDSSFELGRRFHVFVDREREKHMKKHDAYRFIKNGPLKTQMLKIIEDHIMFDQLKGRFDAEEVFGRIYEEERNFLVKESDIITWHNLLRTYLDQSSWLTAFRYYNTLAEFQKAYGLPDELYKNLWSRIRTIGFFIYAYFQVEKLSREPELRAIILDFYQNRIQELIETIDKQRNDRTVELESLSEPKLQIPPDHRNHSAFVIAGLLNKPHFFVERNSWLIDRSGG
jgi:hypothetical protein